MSKELSVVLVGIVVVALMASLAIPLLADGCTNPHPDRCECVWHLDGGSRSLDGHWELECRDEETEPPDEPDEPDVTPEPTTPEGLTEWRCRICVPVPEWQCSSGWWV